jgi:hypothetical protein
MPDSLQPYAKQVRKPFFLSEPLQNVYASSICRYIRILYFVAGEP